jgi:hypothetical protein
MFNLALLLQRKSQYPEAAEYWRRYLTQRLPLGLGDASPPIIEVL